MGQFNIHVMSQLSKEEFRILTAIEIGMKNHEMVPGPLVHQLANIRNGKIARMLYGLAEHRLVSYDRGKHCDGYRLTDLGYDYLALKCLLSKSIVSAVAGELGCGKESHIYEVQDHEGTSRCMKIHRLGKTSFKKVKNLRDYHNRRHISSWLYLSRISADREYKFMQVLHDNGFPVPKPYGYNRHIVIMELIKGCRLNHMKELQNPEKLYTLLMDLMLKLANYGLIHCDFNEFNIMITEGEEPVLIDFPQMVSTSHPDAKEYFDRDVENFVDFFKRRYRYVSEDYLQFDDIVREHDLDFQVRASGYNTHVVEEVEKESEAELSDDEEEETLHEDGAETSPEKVQLSDIEEDTDRLESTPSECGIGEDASSDCTNSRLVGGMSKRNQRKRFQMEAMLLRREKMKQEREHASEQGVKFYESRSVASNFSRRDGKSVGGMSLASVSSRSESRFVQGRCKVEAIDKVRAHIPKKALRAKGEANAYNRKRKENTNTIKEVKEALFF